MFYTCKQMVTESRRKSSDRRHRPTPLFSRYSLLGGRRRARRRTDDPRAYYVDRLGGLTWFLLLSVFLFQILDAHLTLTQLSRGGVEVNPIMSYLIQRGATLFVAVKLSVAAIGLLFLGIHKNYPLAKPGLAFLFTLFLIVIGWQCYLVFQPV